VIKSKKLKSDSILTGVAGEYFVAAELSKRGYIASITLRNTRGIDILVSNRNANKSVGIQVKSTKYSNTRSWMLNEKAEDYYADNLFYVFVNLKEKDQRPDFFVVPSGIVARYIKRSHKNWIKKPNRKGGKHKDTSLRRFFDKKGEYLERWDLLKL
jgi:hypothetical protein